VRRTLFLLAILSVPSLAGTDNSYRGAIPFELVLKHIVVNIRVNNSRPLPFILDTGDKFAIVDLDLAKQLGLTLYGDVNAGGAGAAVIHGRLVQNSSFTIPGFNGFSQPITLAIPLKNLEAPLGHEVDGILGGDFIKEFVIRLDYGSRELRLYDKETFRYSGPGQSIPMELDANGHPIVEAEVTPQAGQPLKGKFVVDIGSGAALTLYSSFVAEHHLLGPSLKTIKALGAAGTGGQIQAHIGRVAELKIGEFRLAQPITMFSQDQAGAMATSQIQGNLGQQILNRFTLYLDYSHGRIIFEPNKNVGGPFARAFAGVALEGVGDDYRVLRVKDILEDSPATEAGLNKNDVITAVDGRSTSVFSLSQVAEMFERPGSYSLDVQRGDTKLRLTLRPRRLI
jgi:hypothetical protein